MAAEESVFDLAVGGEVLGDKADVRFDYVVVSVSCSVVWFRSRPLVA